MFVFFVLFGAPLIFLTMVAIQLYLTQAYCNILGHHSTGVYVLVGVVAILVAKVS